MRRETSMSNDLISGDVRGSTNQSNRQVSDRRGKATKPRGRKATCRLEALEVRRLLSVSSYEASLASARNALGTGSIGGITVITHGFQPSDGGGDSLMALAQAVQRAEGGVIVDYDAGVAADPAGSFQVTGTDPSRHVTVLFDWADNSNQLAGGFGGAAGDALFGTLVGLGLVDPEGGAVAGTSRGPLHFIGHSFGTVVTSEAVKRLASYRVPVDQVTYIDPHDFDQGLGFDGAQRLFDVGLPSGYGAAVWDNVSFTDVYYQTEGLLLVPNGRPIPGAYNVLVNDRVGGINPHGDIVDNFYIGTIKRFAAGDTSLRDGYAFVNDSSLRTIGASAAQFYSSAQDHRYSEENLVIKPASGALGGTPNVAGLRNLGLTASDINSGTRRSNFSRNVLYNGDFRYDASSASDKVPGWNTSGGELRGKTITGAGVVTAQNPASHSIVYIPKSAQAIQYQVSVAAQAPLAELVVRVGTTVIERLPLATATGSEKRFNGFEKRTVALSPALLGTASTISFAIEGGSAGTSPNVVIDGVNFAQPTTVAVVPVIDRSGSMAGQPLTDAKTSATLFARLLQNGDNLGIASFSDTSRVDFPLTQINTTGGIDAREQAAAKIALITDGGRTSIGAGLEDAIDELKKVTSNSPRAIVLLTDGDENVAPWARDVIDQSLPSDVVIYTIGLGNSVSTNLLTEIATRTGGRYVFSATSADLQQIYAELLASVSGSQTFTRASSVVSAGQADAHTVTLDAGVQQATFGLNWTTSPLNLRVVSPSNQVYSNAPVVSATIPTNTLSPWTATGSWGLASNSGTGGTTVLTDSPTGNYGSNVNTTLTLNNSFVVPAVNGVSLKLNIKYDFETNYDYGRVEISSNGGGTWTELAKYTGTVSSFTDLSIPLDAYKGQSVKIRFRLTSDSYVTGDGWYIKSVSIQQPPTYPDATFSSDQTYAFLQVSSPMQGQWRIEALGGATTPQNYAYNYYVIGDAESRVKFSTESLNYTTGQVARLSLEASDSRGPITGGTAQAVVKTPSGASISVALVDNGTGADSVAGDGIYTVAFNQIFKAGNYSVAATFSLSNSAVTLNRQAQGSFVATGADITGASPVILVGNSVIASGSASVQSLGQYKGGPALARTFTLRNDGASPLSVAGVDVPQGFTLSTAPGTSVAPGASTTFTVTMTSTSVGVVSGAVTVRYNGLSSSSFNVSGEVVPGKPVVLVSGVAIAAGDPPQSFGARDNGGPVPTLNFTLLNDGGTSIKLAVPQLPAGYEFVVDNLPGSLAPGETLPFALRLVATTAGAFPGNVTFAAAGAPSFVFPVIGVVAPARLTVLTGSTVIQQSDPATSLGTYGGGSVRPSRTFTVRNDGGATLGLSSLSTAAGFQVDPLGVSTLLPGQTATVVVRLAARKTGSAVGTVSIGSSIGTFVLNVSGEVAPALPVVRAGQTVLTGSGPAYNLGTFDGQSPRPVGTFTVTNEGAGDLDISGVLAQTGFEVLGLSPTSLGSGESTTFSVRLSATTAGTTSGTVTLVSTGQSSNNVTSFAVTGFVTVGRLTVLSAGVALPTVPSVVAGQGGTGSDVETTLIQDFGQFNGRGGRPEKSFTFRNDGGADLKIDQVVLPAGFGLVGNAPSAISAGQTASVTVRLTSDQPGKLSGPLTVRVNNNTGSFKMNLSASVNVAVLVVLNGSTAVDPARADNLGRYSGGPRPTRTYTLRNDGNVDLDVDSVTPPAGFVIVGSTPGKVAAGSTANITLRLSRLEAGVVSGSVIFSGNGGATVSQVTVEGEIAPGRLVIEPATAALALRDRTVNGTASTATVTLRNTGGAALVVQALSPSGLQVSPSDFTIPVDGSAQVTVRMPTSVVGNYSGNIIFNTDSSDTPSSSIQAAGVVRNGPIVAISSSVLTSRVNSFVAGDSAAGGSASVTLVNQGNQSLLSGSPVLTLTAVPVAGGDDVLLASKAVKLSKFESVFSRVVTKMSYKLPKWMVGLYDIRASVSGTGVTDPEMATGVVGQVNLAPRRVAITASPGTPSGTGKVGGMITLPVNLLNTGNTAATLSLFGRIDIKQGDTVVASLSGSTGKVTLSLLRQGRTSIKGLLPRTMSPGTYTVDVVFGAPADGSTTIMPSTLTFSGVKIS